MTVINYYKFLDLVYTFFCEQFVGLGIFAHIFYRKTARASSFNSTHYLVLMFFLTHTSRLNAPKISLEIQVKNERLLY